MVSYICRIQKSIEEILINSCRLLVSQHLITLLCWACGSSRCPSSVAFGGPNRNHARQSQGRWHVGPRTIKIHRIQLNYNNTYAKYAQRCSEYARPCFELWKNGLCQLWIAMKPLGLLASDHIHGSHCLAFQWAHNQLLARLGRRCSVFVRRLVRKLM